MKRISYFLFLKTLLTSIFILWVENTSATNYYVSNNGDDANAGTSRSLAWATISKVNAMNFSPGDSVLFEAGDTWRGMLDINQSGTSGKYIVYSRYGSGNNPRILASEKAQNWTATGTANIWQAAGSLTNPRTNSPSEIFFVKDDSTSWGDYQTYSADFANLTKEFDWTFNGGSVFCYALSDPDTRYDNVEVPQRDQSIRMLDNAPKEFIEINGIDMLYAKSKGFYSGYPARNVANLIFRKCHIAYIGEKGGASCYGLSVFHSNLLVENCFITDCGRRGVSFNLYLIVNESERRVINNVIVRHNLFKRGYHTTSLDLASSGDRSFAERPDTISNVYFYGNYIDDSEIEMTGEDEPSNQIFTQQGGIILKNIYIVNNIFVAATARNILIEGGDSVYVWNNTIVGHNQNGIPTPYSNISFNHSLNNDYRNNILYQNLPDNSTTNYGLLMQHAPSNYMKRDYNLYYQEVENSNRGFTGGLHGYYNMSDWTTYRNGNTLFDSHSPTPGNPVFVDLKNKNFAISINSPASGAGTPVYIKVTDPFGKTDTVGKYDFIGTLRHPVNPSIGAFEFLDLEDPLAPWNLKAKMNESGIEITWVASADNIGVVGYRVYRDGELVGTSETTSYMDNNGLILGNSYNYTIIAYDASGNESIQSDMLVIDSYTTNIDTPQKQNLKVIFSPNPTSNKVTIHFDENYPSGTFFIKFYSLTGQLIYETLGYSGNNVNIQVEYLNPGVYLANVVFENNETFFSQLVISR